jgi:hypothetical protein
MATRWLITLLFTVHLNINNHVKAITLTCAGNECPRLAACEAVNYPGSFTYVCSNTFIPPSDPLANAAITTPPTNDNGNVQQCITDMVASTSGLIADYSSTGVCTIYDRSTQYTTDQFDGAFDLSAVQYFSLGAVVGLASVFR